MAADEVFNSYASLAAQELTKLPESGGFFTDWLFNMFAGTIDIQFNSPKLTLVYLGILLVLVLLRLYAENPIKSLGCALLYIYTTIQAYTLFRASAFVTDFTPAGWLVTAGSAPGGVFKI